MDTDALLRFAAKTRTPSAKVTPSTSFRESPKGFGRAYTNPPFQVNDSRGRSYFFLISKGIGETTQPLSTATDEYEKDIIERNGSFSIRSDKNGVVVKGASARKPAEAEAKVLDKLLDLGFRSARPVLIAVREDEIAQQMKPYLEDEPVVYVRAFNSLFRLANLIELKKEENFNDLNQVISFEMSLMNKSGFQVKNHEDYFGLVLDNFFHDLKILITNGIFHGNLNYGNITVNGEILDLDELLYFGSDKLFTQNVPCGNLNKSDDRLFITLSAGRTEMALYMLQEIATFLGVANDTPELGNQIKTRINQEVLKMNSWMSKTGTNNAAISFIKDLQGIKEKRNKLIGE